MIEFESYKDNVTVTDKHGIQDVPVSKRVSYTGALSTIIKEKYDDVHKDIPPMAAAVIGLNNTAASMSTSTKTPDCWTDIDAQESFLNSKPTCYLILGKPGAGGYLLGEALSKKLNCIHLCPKNIILDEMDQGSPTGKCISFNLKHQNVLKYDVILSIMKNKLQSPAVKHRGYVISGVPLISSDNKPQYLSSTLNSEEAVLVNEDLIYDTITNLNKKNLKKSKLTALSSRSSVNSESGVQEEEEIEEEHETEELGEEGENVVVQLPKFILDPCLDIIFSKQPNITTKQIVFLEQFHYLFNLSIEPDIVIYLTCPDKDLVTKRYHKYFNYTNNVYTFDPFIVHVETEIRWPTKYISSDYVSPYDGHIFNPKYNCRQPFNFIRQSTDQICNYKKYVLPFAEEKLKDFKPKHVIKLDARTSLHQMMHLVNERLILLPIKPVLIPEPLYIEETPEALEDFWKLVEELNVIHGESIKFNRYPSLWLNRCPVELQKGRSVIGDPKLAVTMFKHVYLLSSLDSMIKFCRNPRPYLNLKYLEPTCRVIVIGTQTSGKTMISQCLSWLFDSTIINYETFVEEERMKKYDSFSKSILSEIIASIEDARLLKWQNEEMERINCLDEWDKTNFKVFKTYVGLFLDILKVMKRDEITEEDIEDLEAKQDHKDPDPQLLTDYNNLKNQLAFIPYLDDYDQCMTVIQAKTLAQFAPEVLTTTTEKPRTPILGDTDVTEAITNYIATNDLQKEILPTNEELMNEIIKILSDNDEKSLKNFGTYGRFIIDGFPSDPEFWSYLSDSKLLPDHTIALIENRDIEPELMKYYVDVAKCYKNHHERIALCNDPLIKIKLLTKDLPASNYQNMRDIVNESINNMLDSIDKPLNEVNLVRHDEENPDTHLMESFSSAIEKFREDWDSVKQKLYDFSKLYVEVELENKTDIEVIDEVLLNMRKNYYLTCEVIDDEEYEQQYDEDETYKDIIHYNDPQYLCETKLYCPIAFYKYHVLWKGKPEFRIKHNNKLHYLCKEDCSEMFLQDVVSYQKYNIPNKTFPPLRICVIGCIGSGKTSVSKVIARELGLLHVDFSEMINTLLMPRHFKKVGRQYENHFTDISIDEEGVMEFQMDEENENNSYDILGNETELRRMVYRYFEQGTPMFSVLLQKLIKKLWFEEPFKDTGFVLDGFPRLPSDVEDMLSCYCIPDLVIELESNSDSMIKRLSKSMYKTWKTQLNEAKHKAKVKLDNETSVWMNFITKTVVVKLIFEEILDNIFTDAEQSGPQLSAESVIMDAHPQGSTNVDFKLFSHYNNVIQEYPAPTDTSEWEKPDEARERIDARLEGIYEVDEDAINSFKDILIEQRIDTISVDATKPLNKVLRNVLLKLKNLRNRCISFFEQTFVIGYDIAEMLVMEGFYCLSKYHRMCPVYIYENPNTISNPFKIMKRKDKVFPVIHRAFIYFIFGEESLQKFRENPLMYVNTDCMKSFKEYPLTMSVVGPPKSGKTIMAKKLARRYGLMYLSRGVAIRYILEHMYWTELGIKIKTALDRGDCLQSEHIISAVQTVAIDHRTTTYGFVFDGFPESASEAMELANAGLYPNIILDITVDKESITKQTLGEIYLDIIKIKPPYSAPFIENRFKNWSKKSYLLRNWVQDDFQNIYPINGKESRWQCLQNAIKYIDGYIPHIHNYLINASDKIVSASCMCISEEIFRKKMSHFNNMCPLCLQNNTLRHGDHPVDKKGVVQFENTFYWICPDHMNSVFTDPKKYLLVEKIDIPEVPAVVKTVNVSLVYENGICIVTYAQNLPKQIIKMGSRSHAASYKGKTFMFCSVKCLESFLAKPHLYYDVIVFKETKAFPKLSLNKLPNIGYLEQTIGDIITDACCSVNVLRPKYPGLNIKMSALLYIALYLKTHNPKADKRFVALYNKASKVYDARCKLIIDIGLRLRSMDNPFVNYPKCCNKGSRIYVSPGTVRKDSSITYETSSLHTSVSECPSRVPVPDERFDYLCEFHKPASKVPAFLNVVDIAGLVRGAAEGQGLGNAFLSHIKACDAIFNLCRAFDDEDVIHVDGDVNPVRDLETIGEELRLKDEEQLLQNLEKLDRVVNRGGEKKLKPEYDALAKIKTILVDEKKHIRFGDWSAADIEVLNKYLFLTSKPALYLVNLSEKDYIRKKNKWLPKLKEWIDKNDPGAPLIPFSGALETKLFDMDSAEKQAFLKENNVTSALDKIIVQGYKALHLEYFFTAGPDEVKAWTIQKGTKAPQAAGRIHTDFEKGFIMAEVMHFKDFREEGTEAACKAAGKYRQQGRNYVVEDGDIIFFKFNAGAGLKDAKKK